MSFERESICKKSNFLDVNPSITPDLKQIKFDLPNPEEKNLSKLEFLAELEKAWNVCDKFDLQTDIWRGRILRSVRDREKIGGEGRGAGFLQWLREREISKTRAYTLIQLAESADNLVISGSLESESVNNFSRRAFIETAQANPEVQQMITEAANEGQEITRKQVKRLNDEFTAVTSMLLPEEVKEKTQSNLLPSRVVAPLVRELAKLPELHQVDFKKSLKEDPEIECIKDLTNTAKWIGKSMDVSLSLRAFQKYKDLDLNKAIDEAKRIEALGLLSDAFGQAQSIESSLLKFHSAWRRLNGLYERLWVESGSSTPYLRDVLNILQTLTGSTMRVSLGELSGGKNLRLQVVEESVEQLEPPGI
tara:strand:+ start:1309 stop:2397 length:1089 start_codon:yes stop_codon:yes gene_type:complete